MVPPPYACRWQAGLTTEFHNGSIKDRKCWNNGNQEAKPGSDEAAAALE
jgi:hypothetical protein